MNGVRTRALVLGVALVASACTPSTNRESVAPTSKGSTTSFVQSEAPRLLISQVDGGVAIIEVDGTMVESIAPPSGARYSQPIWASSEAIVYAQVATGDNRLEAAELGGETIWSVELDTPPFFYLAAPDSTDTTVVSLRNRPDRPGLVIERISSQNPPLVIAAEAPFYASWNPDDGRLAAHIGDARVEILSASTETIDTNASGFQAPIWLPSGLITLRTRGEDTYLTRWSGDSFQDLAKVRGAARFVGSGDNLAIVTGGDIETGGVQASAQSLPTITPGVLTVIDLKEGSFTSVTSDRSPMFQWDPAGEQLLYATFVDDPTPALVWHVWKDGEVTDFKPFTPEPSWFGTVAPFFDQYAQSVWLWSPDGSAFAWPSLVDGEARILVQHLDDTGALDIAAGNWVAWSP